MNWEGALNWNSMSGLVAHYSFLIYVGQWCSSYIHVTDQVVNATMLYSHSFYQYVTEFYATSCRLSREHRPDRLTHKDTDKLWARIAPPSLPLSVPCVCTVPPVAFKYRTQLLMTAELCFS